MNKSEASASLHSHYVRPILGIYLIVSLFFAFCTGCTQPQAIAAGVATSGISRADNFQAVASNGHVLVAANGADTMLLSTDSGVTWTRNDLAAGAVSIIDIATCPNGSFQALDFYHKVWSGSADGRTWLANTLPTEFTPLALTCRADGQLWVVGSETTMASSADEGKTWQVQSLKEDAMLRTVQFLDSAQGVAIGEFGIVVFTSDGGRSWQRRSSLGKDFYPYAAHFDDPRNGWVSGIAGTIMHTNDGGLTWTRQGNASGASFYSLIKYEGHIFAFGDGGRIARLDGQDWIALRESVLGAPYLMSAVDLGTKGVLVAGPAGVLKSVSILANTGTIQ